MSRSHAPMVLRGPRAFRLPMRISAVSVFKTPYGLTAFAICPRCRTPLDRDYQAYCDCCGQALDWDKLHRAAVLMPR